jgi:hypothetical protein
MKLSLSSGKKDARAPPPRETKEEMKVERGNTGVQTETGLISSMIFHFNLIK